VHRRARLSISSRGGDTACRRREGDVVSGAGRTYVASLRLPRLPHFVDDHIQLLRHLSGHGVVPHVDPGGAERAQQTDFKTSLSDRRTDIQKVHSSTQHKLGK
jgi:hypothetical protein